MTPPESTAGNRAAGRREAAVRAGVLATSLFSVFVAAKIAVLAGRPLPASPWAPIAFIWQDAVVALGFFGFAWLIARAWPARVVYATLVALAAINVPVVRALSSPLTASMLRAARGTLTDSILHYATPANLLLICTLLAVGILLPVAMRGQLPHPRAWLVAAGLLLVIGPIATARVDTAGLERNPVIAIARTSMPRVRAVPSDADWRSSPFAARDAAVAPPDLSSRPDLASLRGVAAGANVLLVVLESTGAGYLRPYGAAEDPMPNLSALASRSIVFESAYAVYPESIKGMLAFLSSRYPGFDVAAEQHGRTASPSLASVLRERGYETALFHSGRFFYLGMEEILAGCDFGRLDDAGAIGGNRNSSFGIDEAAAVRHILRWIDSVPRGRPFFAAYLPIAGHHPYTYAAKGPFPEEREIDRYRNSLHEGDRALGELLAGLRARGLDSTTVVAVIGDHGEGFGQHPGNYGHTLAIWEENVHVPFILSVPERRAPGISPRSPTSRGIAQRDGRSPIRAGGTVSLLDLPPTVLDLLGVDRPADFQGESLLAPGDRMALFFTDYSLGLLGLRDGCFKYIHEIESGRSRLFDLCSDPGERTDIASREAARVLAYRSRVREWIAAQVARVRADMSDR